MAQVAPATFREVALNAYRDILAGRAGRHVRYTATSIVGDEIVAWIKARTGVELCSRCSEIVDSGCNCWECGGCGNRYGEHDGRRCESCEACRDCCECPRCSECGEITESFCDDCERGECCCRCAIEVPRHDPGRVTFHGEPTPSLPRYIGVEIECGANPPRGSRPYAPVNEVRRKWGAGIHGDGSIGLRGAMEYVTAPARGEAFIKQIEETCAALSKVRANVDQSCGAHFHIDVRDFTARETLRAARLYSKVEPALYSMIPRSRRGRDGGGYSKPWGDEFVIARVFDKGTQAERLERLEATLYGSVDEAESIKANPYKHECRYHGLNFNSILLYGTLEFRMHSGTTNPRKLIMWAHIVTAIVQYAATHSESSIAKMGGTPWQILTRVVHSIHGDNAGPIIAYMEERLALFAAAYDRDRKLKYDRNALERDDLETGEITRGEEY